ncbi:MAG TPA: non-ribosomal peptide synthetase [Pyrinomonadaceae bacterium]|nr:non-ribosomal peptide synthetase [Pyrinomonadaceae bacterium]
MNQTVYDQFAAQAERSSDVAAIKAPDRSPLTYAQTRSQIEAVRESLNAFGVGRNDRVVIVLDNSPEMAVAFMAVASCSTAVPLNPAYRADEFRFYLSRVNAKALIVSAADQTGVKDLAARLGLKIIELIPHQSAEAGSFELHCHEREAASQTGFAQTDDIALILHTSGTTSAPKIVPLTHQNVCAMAKNNQVALELTETDLCLNIMPLFHSTGLVGVVLSSLISGAGVVCPPGFYAPQFFDWLNEFKPTWFTAVPSMHQAILARARTSVDPVQTRLRFIRSSSSSLPRQLMMDLESVFQAPVIESYGMTECGMIACNPLPPRTRKPRSAGVATTIDIGILDPQRGTFLSKGAEGEIVVRGACVMSGYEAEPTVNQESFTNGWFKTGDQGFLDDDGYLFITGRLKEIINRGGEKIAPLEIDQALLEHPLVEQAVTFPVANDVLGEEVAAAVVLSPDGDVTEMELREFVFSQLAPFKVPRQILFVDEIPKGSFGKLQRSRLAELLQVQARDQNASASEQDYVAPRTHEEIVLADIWSRILGLESVGVYDDFFRLGGDSILATQIVSQVRKIMEVDLSPITIFETPTIAGLVRMLHASRQNAKGITADPIKPIPRG